MRMYIIHTVFLVEIYYLSKSGHRINQYDIIYIAAIKLLMPRLHDLVSPISGKPHNFLSHSA